MKQLTWLILFFLLGDSYGQSRPFIWATNKERITILQKIESQAWARRYYSAYKDDTDKKLMIFQKNKPSLKSSLPFNLNKGDGSFSPINTANGGSRIKEYRDAISSHLNLAVDCGVLYYLTQDKKYATYAAEVLQLLINGLYDLPIQKDNKAGLLYEDNHLLEAREIGAQLPIVYDFIYDYLASEPVIYDIFNERATPFDFQKAQKVFKIYVDLALEKGIIDCNWPILESSSLVCNSLAIENKTLRDSLLQYYLVTNTPHQDALSKVAQHYIDNGGLWPESINYSSGVASYSTYLMTLLTRLKPELRLGRKYPQIPLAIANPYYLTYPNAHETVLFGDSHREFHNPIYDLEMAYTLANIDSSEVLKDEIGNLINIAMRDDHYNRPVYDKKDRGLVYFNPLRLLWAMPNILETSVPFSMPTTNHLKFAGLTIQRNISPSHQPVNDLMSVVAGGAFVHGHASGMNMELYGEGYVLGSKAGRASYGTDIHENYYRLFAGHNTVVVNGASQGEGGWANLAINTVTTTLLEPQHNEKPLSQNHSFTFSSFKDDKGELSKAKQTRLMGIVRTSPTSGYYVDIYRSKSEIANQYHDYIYHNIGDRVTLEDNEGGAIMFTPSPNRYKANENETWIRNRSFRNPGWHFFEDVSTANAITFKAGFEMTGTDKSTISMNLWMPSQTPIEVTQCLAPPTHGAPGKYEKLPTPTVVIRKQGEAWSSPFVAIFEPYNASKEQPTILKTELLTQKGITKGLKILLSVNGKRETDYILFNEKEGDVFEDKVNKIYFDGIYAVVRQAVNGSIISAYGGSFNSLKLGHIAIKFNESIYGNAIVEELDNNPIIGQIQNSVAAKPYIEGIPKTFTVQYKMIKLK